ncbi:hypothetical protein TBK1r_57600 [Stieleria magnilauensis]|uniref:Uncharacterized protein n=1 Tax=Stieleria magnilauensis TaxID=2527963 RepID=A0ABX5Y0P8_9BACT|nr:hypothetical protein TBK1r_57600 [Planctomycetes bacterium TBK1r]
MRSLPVRLTERPVGRRDDRVLVSHVSTLPLLRSTLFARAADLGDAQGYGCKGPLAETIHSKSI